MKKRLVFCFDGTWNTIDAKNPTNVLLTAQSSRRYTEGAINMKRGGVTALPDQTDQAATTQLLNTLGDYGIFVTPLGELEQWLPHLNVSGQKTEWTMAMLQNLGDDPGSATYVRHSNDDVWAFMRQIAVWVKDPARKGTS